MIITLNTIKENINVSTITFCRDDYKEYYEYSHKTETNEDRMFDDIKEFIRIALKNKYVIKVYDDGCTVSIEFGYDDPNMSDTSLEWINNDGFNNTEVNDEEGEELTIESLSESRR